MTKLQKLYEFLTNLQKTVQEKAEAEEQKMTPGPKTHEDCTEEISHQHTIGQLYELNYIIENFWKIISEDN